MINISPGKTRIGWIGTGVMGASMCGHLMRAGFAATVFNRTKAKAEKLLCCRGRLGRKSPGGGRGVGRYLYYRRIPQRRAQRDPRRRRRAFRLHSRAKSLST